MYLIGVFIVIGVVKEYNLLHLQFLGRFKDKRISAVLFSMLAGVLPVPGRVTSSAGLLDTIATKDPDKRKHFGIIDYLATHHYYMWSPLEKTLILPLAALGISYGTWLSYFAIPIIFYFSYLVWYIFKFVPADAIEIEFEKTFDVKEFLLYTAPIFASIVVAVFVSPIIVFAVLAAYYAIYMYMKVEDANVFMKKIVGYINWKLTFLLAFILAVSVTAIHYAELTTELQPGVIYGTAIAIFFITLFTGEEDLYAALNALILPTIGVFYLPLMWFSGYFAYSISPLHKCIWISTGYFGTPIRRYYKVIAGLLAGLAIYVAGFYLVNHPTPQNTVQNVNTHQVLKVTPEDDDN